MGGFDTRLDFIIFSRYDFSTYFMMTLSREFPGDAVLLTDEHET